MQTSSSGHTCTETHTKKTPTSWLIPTLELVPFIYIYHGHSPLKCLKIYLFPAETSTVPILQAKYGLFITNLRQRPQQIVYRLISGKGDAFPVMMSPSLVMTTIITPNRTGIKLGMAMWAFHNKKLAISP